MTIEVVPARSVMVHISTCLGRGQSSAHDSECSVSILQLVCSVLGLCGVSGLVGTGDYCASSNRCCNWRKEGVEEGL